MTETVRRYLEDEEARAQIAANACELVTREMTIANSLRQLMELAEPVKRGKLDEAN